MSSTYSYVMEKRSPKSPMPKSPMPKSPVPKSPVYEKYKSRCAYGLLSFFHFRQSHSKKLIYDKGRLKRHANGNGFVRKRVDLLSNIEEKYECIDDGIQHKTVTANSGNAEVKKIVGKEMPIEKPTKKITTAKVEHVKFDSELGGDLSRNHRKATKTSQRPRRLPIYGCYDVATMGNTKTAHQNLMDRSSKKSGHAVISETGRDCNCKTINNLRYDQHNEVNLRLPINEATEAFINQKLIDGKHFNGDGADHQSKHFMDALEILNSNKDLFIKLLQDPNSLLVKHIDDLRYCQSRKQQTHSLNEAKLSEHQANDARDCKELACSQSLKSSDRYLSKGTGDPQPLENIVVLTSGSTRLQNSEDRISYDSPQIFYRLSTVQQSVRPAFSPFVKMKRKLMYVIGVSRKKQQLMLTDGAVHKSIQGSDLEKCGKGTGLKIVERNAPDISSFNCETMTISSMDLQRKDQMSKAKKSESGVADEAVSVSETGHVNSNLSIVRHLKQNKHDINVESRIRLSELLNNGNADFLRKQRPNTWDGMSYVPEYDLLPMVSSKRKGKDGFVAPQTRFSPYYQMMSKNMQRNLRKGENSLSPLRQNVLAPPQAGNGKPSDLPQMLETKPNISDKLFPDVKVHESVSSLENDLSARGFLKNVEMKDSKVSEDISPSKVPSEPDGPHRNGANQSRCTANTSAENGAFDFLRLDSPEENQTSPSPTGYYSSPLSIHRVENFDRIKDRVEQPSPVSVLEEFFVEDITSPLCAEFQPAESSVLPVQIGVGENDLASLVQFPLDLKINSSSAMAEHGSMFEYVSTLLQASDFNMDELILKYHLSDKLDQSCDRKLLSDYFIEVLLEVYQCYLRSSAWLSFIKPKSHPVMMAENMVHEVMKYVDQNLLLQPPLQNVEQLVKKDLTTSGTWMNIRIDTEEMVSIIVESILEELIAGISIE